MQKYVVGKNQKHLIVSQDVHMIVKSYARENNLTMVEATYQLLRIAFERIYNRKPKD
jgi:hypothetical protein